MLPASVSDSRLVFSLGLWERTSVFERIEKSNFDFVILIFHNLEQSGSVDVERSDCGGAAACCTVAACEESLPV